MQLSENINRERLATYVESYRVNTGADVAYFKIGYICEHLSMMATILPW